MFYRFARNVGIEPTREGFGVPTDTLPVSRIYFKDRHATVAPLAYLIYHQRIRTLTPFSGYRFHYSSQYPVYSFDSRDKFRGEKTGLEPARTFLSSGSQPDSLPLRTTITIFNLHSPHFCGDYLFYSPYFCGIDRIRTCNPNSRATIFKTA